MRAPRSSWATRERTRKIAALGACSVGLLGLLSALSAPARDRLEAIRYLVPALAPETAGVTLVFICFALVLMARGLRRGLRMAWVSTIGLLVASIAVHTVHGSFFAASVPPALAAAWLATKSSAFPVAQSRRAVKRAVVVAAGGVAACLGLSTTLAVTLDHSDADAAVGATARRMAGLTSLPLDNGGRFATPALLAVGLCLLTVTLWSLLSPLRAALSTSEERHVDRRRAREIVRQYGGDTLAYFALRNDKQWFFAYDSVVAYAVRGGVCVVSPDPIGPSDERDAVWNAFSTFVEESGWSISVLGASADWLPTYEKSGLRSVYLGDEAIIRCQDFTVDGRTLRAARQAHSRVRRAGYSIALLDPATLDERSQSQLTELAALCRQGSCERGFSMTLSRLFDPEDEGLLMSVAYDSAGVPQAFVQWVPCGDGWSLDVMRRNTAQGLTNGIIEYLIIESIHAFAARGDVRVGLNFAVFRTVVSGETRHWFGRTARIALQSAASQTQIESLWRFNAKFGPDWVPRYAVLGSVDAMAAQSVVMAGAEGLTELPLVGRFMTGMAPH
jgi:lysyl-tRNA synthetase class 2